MKFKWRNIISVVVLFTLLGLSPAPTLASELTISITELIKTAVRRTIKAVDLKIQRLQNKTIWLQNACKLLENQMTARKLNEISRSSHFYNQLYEEYFAELKNAKHMITQYHKIREIARIQSLVVTEYQKVWWLLQKDPNFSAGELRQMSHNYQDILESSLMNTDLLIHVISSYSSSMTDGQRLKLIRNVETKVYKNFKVLQHYNRHNGLISLQRAHTSQQQKHIKLLYGLKPINQLLYE